MESLKNKMAKVLSAAGTIYEAEPIFSLPKPILKIKFMLQNEFNKMLKMDNQNMKV
jgi:hypothetical protein